MTRKDYELIAYCIFTSNIYVFCKDTQAEKLARKHTAEWFADNLQEKNPLFSRKKFLTACGLAGSISSYCENCGIFMNDYPTVRCNNCGSKTIEKRCFDT